MDPNCLEKLNEERRARRAAVLVTDLKDGTDRVVGEGEEVAGELGSAISAAFLSGKSCVTEADGRSYFLNVHVPPPRIVIIGAVHISQALAPMARLAGFDVTIVDPRTAFATADRFPDVELLAEWPQDYLENNPLDAFTAVVAVTHDPKIDDMPIQNALDAGCFYIGALGSRKTHAKRVDRLKDAGVSHDRINLIKAPIGLDIGAASPAEIAVAILAQIIHALRTRNAKSGKTEIAA